MTRTATGDAPIPVPIAQIDPWVLPVGVDVVTAERVPIKDPLGRVVGWKWKFIVAVPAGFRRSRLVPAELARAVEDHNRFWQNVIALDLYGNPWKGTTAAARSSNAASPQADAPAPRPFVGTVLDFGLHFEVKK